MGTGLVALILALLLPLGASAEAVLNERLQQFPEWQLPAPLPRPRRGDLEYPSWFEGHWQLQASDGVSAQVRFKRRSDGAVVGDRAGNALAIGRAVLGDALLEVQDDPSNPNRQLARLSDERQLDTRITGRRSEQPNTSEFLADELSLQLLKQAGLPPRSSRIETLSRYQLLGPDQISGEQWQATYASPEQGLAATARSSQRTSLTLTRLSEP
ncbi:MAG: POLO box duplicated region [Synechococcus sp.]|nr:POLO box duplicated region [Synechococcus sp.]